MKNNYTLLHCHDYYSLLDSPAKPQEIAKRAAHLDMDAIAITNHGNVSSAIEFQKACKNNNIKSILGCELYLCDQDPSIHTPQNRANTHLVVLAKNYKGWIDLIRLVSQTNTKDFFYYKPRIDLNNLGYFCNGNILAFSGHPGSDLSNCLFTDFKEAYAAKTLNEANQYLNPDWKKIATKLAKRYRDIFGKENFFLEIQNLNQKWMPAQSIIAGCLREISKSTKIPCVATADAHYVAKENKRDQQIILCSQFKTTIQEVRSKINNNEDVVLSGFFKDSIYHIPSVEEMQYNTTEELQNTQLIKDMCESYSLLKDPQLPKFSNNEIGELKALCQEGMIRKNLNNSQKHQDTLDMELKVIEKWNLAGYFLIVQDYVQYAKSQNYLVGPGRGCFLPDTRVKMSDGYYTPIAFIKKGDKVIDAYNNEQTVYDTMTYEINEDILELEFENNKIIRCTKDHKFLTQNRGWVEAQNLTDDDEIVEIK